MSAVIETFLVCDGCGTNFGVDVRSYTVVQHRQSAAECGWKRKGNRDYCPKCEVPVSKPKKKKEQDNFFKNWEETIRVIKDI